MSHKEPAEEAACVSENNVSCGGGGVALASSSWSPPPDTTDDDRDLWLLMSWGMLCGKDRWMGVIDVIVVGVVACPEMRTDFGATTRFVVVVCTSTRDFFFRSFGILPTTPSSDA